MTLKKLILATLLLSSATLFAESYSQMKKKAYGLYKSGDKNEAFSVVDTFIANNPKEYKAQNLSAVLHYWSGEHKKAQSILEKIVAKTDFPEAQKLLTRVNVKLEKVAKAKNKSYKAIRKANKKSQTTDLEYLVSQVEDHPNDVKNRVLLSKFYFKIEEYQKSFDLAYEVLKMNPNNKKMKAIVAHLSNKYKLTYSAAIDDESVVDKEKAKSLLKKLHDEKKYNAYYNLYKALDNAHVTFTPAEYIDILHASIMIGKYKTAQHIIAKGVIPSSKNALKVQLLLSQKLAQSVASN